jgi:hexokinase
MISGMYMGEIVRLIILDLMQQDLLFIGQREGYGDYKTPLFTRGGFYTKFVSTVETDEGIAFSNTRRVLEDIGIRNPTFDDCAVIQHICKNVSKRAARLSGAGINQNIIHAFHLEEKIRIFGHLCEISVFLTNLLSRERNF